MGTEGGLGRVGGEGVETRCSVCAAEGSAVETRSRQLFERSRDGDWRNERGAEGDCATEAPSGGLAGSMVA